MDHLGYSIRRLLSINKDKHPRKGIDGPVIRMSDLNTSSTDSLKNVKCSTLKKEKSKPQKSTKSAANAAKREKLESLDIEKQFSSTATENSEVENMTTEATHQRTLADELNELDFQRFVQDISVKIIDNEPLEKTELFEGRNLFARFFNEDFEKIDNLFGDHQDENVNNEGNCMAPSEKHDGTKQAAMDNAINRSRQEIKYCRIEGSLKDAEFVMKNDQLHVENHYSNEKDLKREIKEIIINGKTVQEFQHDIIEDPKSPLKDDKFTVKDSKCSDQIHESKTYSNEEFQHYRIEDRKSPLKDDKFTVKNSKCSDSVHENKTYSIEGNVIRADNANNEKHHFSDCQSKDKNVLGDQVVTAIKGQGICKMNYDQTEELTEENCLYKYLTDITQQQSQSKVEDHIKEDIERKMLIKMQICEEVNHPRCVYGDTRREVKVLRDENRILTESDKNYSQKVKMLHFEVHSNEEDPNNTSLKGLVDDYVVKNIHKTDEESFNHGGEDQEENTHPTKFQLNFSRTEDLQDWQQHEIIEQCSSFNNLELQNYIQSTNDVNCSNRSDNGIKDDYKTRLGDLEGGRVLKDSKEGMILDHHEFSRKYSSGQNKIYFSKEYIIEDQNKDIQSTKEVNSSDEVQKYSSITKHTSEHSSSENSLLNLREFTRHHSSLNADGDTNNILQNTQDKLPQYYCVSKGLEEYAFEDPKGEFNSLNTYILQDRHLKTFNDEQNNAIKGSDNRQSPVFKTFEDSRNSNDISIKISPINTRRYSAEQAIYENLKPTTSLHTSTKQANHEGANPKHFPSLNDEIEETPDLPEFGESNHSLLIFKYEHHKENLQNQSLPMKRHSKKEIITFSSHPDGTSEAVRVVKVKVTIPKSSKGDENLVKTIKEEDMQVLKIFNHALIVEEIAEEGKLLSIHDTVKDACVVKNAPKVEENSDYLYETNQEDQGNLFIYCSDATKIEENADNIFNVFTDDSNNENNRSNQCSEFTEENADNILNVFTDDSNNENNRSNQCSEFTEAYFEEASTIKLNSCGFKEEYNDALNTIAFANQVEEIIEEHAININSQVGDHELNNTFAAQPESSNAEVDASTVEYNCSNRFNLIIDSKVGKYITSNVKEDCSNQLNHDKELNKGIDDNVMTDNDKFDTHPSKIGEDYTNVFSRAHEKIQTDLTADLKYNNYLVSDASKVEGNNTHIHIASDVAIVQDKPTHYFNIRSEVLEVNAPKIKLEFEDDSDGLLTCGDMGNRYIDFTNDNQQIEEYRQTSNIEEGHCNPSSNSTNVSSAKHRVEDGNDGLMNFVEASCVKDDVDHDNLISIDSVLIQNEASNKTLINIFPQIDGNGDHGKLISKVIIKNDILNDYLSGGSDLQHHIELESDALKVFKPFSDVNEDVALVKTDCDEIKHGTEGIEFSKTPKIAKFEASDKLIKNFLNDDLQSTSDDTKIIADNQNIEDRVSKSGKCEEHKDGLGKGTPSSCSINVKVDDSRERCTFNDDTKLGNYQVGNVTLAPMDNPISENTKYIVKNVEVKREELMIEDFYDASKYVNNQDLCIIAHDKQASLKNKKGLVGTNENTEEDAINRCEQITAENSKDAECNIKINKAVKSGKFKEEYTGVSRADSIESDVMRNAEIIISKSNKVEGQDDLLRRFISGVTIEHENIVQNNDTNIEMNLERYEAEHDVQAKNTAGYLTIKHDADFRANYGSNAKKDEEQFSLIGRQLLIDAHQRIPRRNEDVLVNEIEHSKTASQKKHDFFVDSTQSALGYKGETVVKHPAGVLKDAKEDNSSNSKSISDVTYPATRVCKDIQEEIVLDNIQEKFFLDDSEIYDREYNGKVEEIIKKQRVSDVAKSAQKDKTKHLTPNLENIKKSCQNTYGGCNDIIEDTIKKRFVSDVWKPNQRILDNNTENQTSSEHVKKRGTMTPTQEEGCPDNIKNIIEKHLVSDIWKPNTGIFDDDIKYLAGSEHIGITPANDEECNDSVEDIIKKRYVGDVWKPNQRIIEDNSLKQVENSHHSMPTTDEGCTNNVEDVLISNVWRRNPRILEGNSKHFSSLEHFENSGNITPVNNAVSPDNIEEIINQHFVSDIWKNNPRIFEDKHLESSEHTEKHCKNAPAENYKNDNEQRQKSDAVKTQIDHIFKYSSPKQDCSDSKVETYQDTKRKHNRDSKHWYRSHYGPLYQNTKIQQNDLINNIINDVYKPQTESKTNEDCTIEEERIRKLINRSHNYKPLMGKNALLARTRLEKSDSEIVQELVTQRFSNFFDSYYQRSFHRQTSRLQNRTEDFESEHFDEDSLDFSVHASTPTGERERSYRRESGEFLRFCSPSSSVENCAETPDSKAEQFLRLSTTRAGECANPACRPSNKWFSFKFRSGNKCGCVVEGSKNQDFIGETPTDFGRAKSPHRDPMSNKDSSLQRPKSGIFRKKSQDHRRSFEGARSLKQREQSRYSGIENSNILHSTQTSKDYSETHLATNEERTNLQNLLERLQENPRHNRKRLELQNENYPASKEEFRKYLPQEVVFEDRSNNKDLTEFSIENQKNINNQQTIKAHDRSTTFKYEEIISELPKEGRKCLQFDPSGTNPNIYRQSYFEDSNENTMHPTTIPNACPSNINLSSKAVEFPIRSKAFSPSSHPEMISSITSLETDANISIFEPSFQSTIARTTAENPSKLPQNNFRSSSRNVRKTSKDSSRTAGVSSSRETVVSRGTESRPVSFGERIPANGEMTLDREERSKSESTATITDSLDFYLQIDDMKLDFLLSTDDHNVETSAEVLEKEKSEEFFDDESDKVSYDAHKFLRDALGDELKMYISTDSQLISDLDYSENQSIGTSNISDLLSKASSYGAMQHASEKAPKRTSTIYEETQYSQNEYADYISSSKKLADLILEANVQNQILAQTHKALSLCRKTKEFVASIEEIEAERILLIATLKREALKEEIHKIEYEDISDSPYQNTGCVRIKGLTFPPKPRNSFVPNLFDKRRKDFTHWFVGVLKSGATVFATKPVIPDSDGMVKFDEEFVFENLSPDFNIIVAIYVIKIKNNLRNYSHESKFHLNKNPKTLCPSPHKLFNITRDTKTKSPEDTMGSSFGMGGKCVIGINNLKDLGYFKLTDMPLCSMLEGTVVINFLTSVTMKEEFSDFLNVGAETGEFITWNRRWCSIKGPYLLYFNYPEDEEPISRLDLSYCITSYISCAERKLCARPRTLLLETALKGSSDHSPKVVKHFLAADTVQGMKVWEAKLNQTVSALRNWNCMKCNFVFNKK